MAEEIGVVTATDMRLILDTVRWIRSTGFKLLAGASAGLGQESLAPLAINASGAAIPAYGVVQLIGTTEKETNLVRADYVADKFAVAGPYAFVGPFGCGSAATERVALQLGRIVRVLTDGSTITAGDRWGVQTGDDWTLQPDYFGQFVAIGADDVADDVGVFLDLGVPDLWRQAKPDSNVTAGSSGTFSVFRSGTDTTENVTAYYDWADDGETLEAGTEGWVRWNPAAGRWDWMGGACGP